MAGLTVVQQAFGAVVIEKDIPAKRVCTPASCSDLSLKLQKAQRWHSGSRLRKQVSPSTFSSQPHLLIRPSSAASGEKPFFINLVEEKSLASNIFSFYMLRGGSEGSELCIGCLSSENFPGGRISNRSVCIITASDDLNCSHRLLPP